MRKVFVGFFAFAVVMVSGQSYAQENSAQKKFDNLRAHTTKDIPAKVLNYSSTADENGNDMYFWYKEAGTKCTYAEAAYDPPTKKFYLKFDEVNFDDHDPRSITVSYTKGKYGIPAIVVSGDHGLDVESIVFDHTRTQAIIDREVRGWTLVYSKYCTGKKSDF